MMALHVQVIYGRWMFAYFSDVMPLMHMCSLLGMNICSVTYCTQICGHDRPVTRLITNLALEVAINDWGRFSSFAAVGVG
jgi:hypothetical protein